MRGNPRPPARRAPGRPGFPGRRWRHRSARPRTARRQCLVRSAATTASTFCRPPGKEPADSTNFGNCSSHAEQPAPNTPIRVVPASPAAEIASPSTVVASNGAIDPPGSDHRRGAAGGETVADQFGVLAQAADHPEGQQQVQRGDQPDDDHRDGEETFMSAPCFSARGRRGDRGEQVDQVVEADEHQRDDRPHDRRSGPPVGPRHRAARCRRVPRRRRR